MVQTSLRRGRFNLSASNTLVACLFNTNLWMSVVEVVGTYLYCTCCSYLRVWIKYSYLGYILVWIVWYNRIYKISSTVSNPINPSPSGWYTISSPWINSIFLERGKLIKLYLSLRLLYPSRPVAVHQLKFPQ